MKKNSAFISILLISILFITTMIFLSFGSISINKEVFILFIITLLILIIPNIILLFLGKFEIFSFFTLFSIFIGLYTLVEPLNILIGVSPRLPHIEKVMVIQIIAIISYILGSIFVYLILQEKKLKVFSVLSNRKPSFLVLVSILTLGFLMFGIYFFGIGAHLNVSKMQLSLNKQESSWLSSFSFGIKFVSISLIVLFMYIKEHNYKTLFFFITGLYILMMLMIGERGEILALIFPLLLIFHFKYKKIPALYSIIIGIGGYLVFNIYGRLSGTTFIDKMLYLYENFEFDWILDFTGELQTSTRNLSTLVASNYENIYTFGSSYLAIITNFIPSSFWPDRPINAVGWFNREFYNSLMGLGGGRGFSLIGEGYINGGVIGVIIQFVIIGILGNFLYFNYCNNKNNFNLLVYVTLIPIIFYGMRADLSTIIGQYIKGAVVPIVLIYIMRFKKYGKKA